MCHLKPLGDHSLPYSKKGTNQVCRTCMHYKSKLAWVLVIRSKGGVSVIGQPLWHITPAFCGSYRFLQFVTGYRVAIACYNISLVSYKAWMFVNHQLMGWVSQVAAEASQSQGWFHIFPSLSRCIFHKHASNCMSTHIDVQ